MVKSCARGAHPGNGTPTPLAVGGGAPLDRQAPLPARAPTSAGALPPPPCDPVTGLRIEILPPAPDIPVLSVEGELLPACTRLDKILQIHLIEDAERERVRKEIMAAKDKLNRQIAALETELTEGEKRGDPDCACTRAERDDLLSQQEKILLPPRPCRTLEDRDFEVLFVRFRQGVHAKDHDEAARFLRMMLVLAPEASPGMAVILKDELRLMMSRGGR